MNKDYDTMCFACGKRNQIGLKLEFFEDQEDLVTVFTPGEEHQGYMNIIHGGITATILDEMSAQRVLSKGILAFTASLEVRYKKKIPIGKPLTFRSRIIKHKSRMYLVEAEAILEDGTVGAAALAKIMEEADQGAK